MGVPTANGAVVPVIVGESVVGTVTKPLKVIVPEAVSEPETVNGPTVPPVIGR